jgi:hypothetical protein
MIATIYARKSTEQNGVSDYGKLVPERQPAFVLLLGYTRWIGEPSS